MQPLVAESNSGDWERMAVKTAAGHVKRGRVIKKKNRRESTAPTKETPQLAAPSDETLGRCINCGGELELHHGVRLCPRCNSDDLAMPFIMQDDDDEYVFIECPGASLYDPDTGEVIAGARFLDEDDPTKGYRIVDRPVHPPTHRRWRRIRKDALGHIRRCQACQDYTIRMRRKEGADFFIPSNKYPGRTKLKSISHNSLIGKLSTRSKKPLISSGVYVDPPPITATFI